ncbi:MAG: hypothetical protein J7513_17995 [Solirubrobacteraceae bacterium]|nr:hypothetical protein [Solirubrobacteraceae bacterium]
MKSRTPALAAAVITLLPAASAGAVQTSTITYQCKYPLIGIKALSLKISLDIPDTWPTSTPTNPFGVTAVASAYDMAAGLAAVDGLTSIKGSSTAFATVKTAQGFNVPAKTVATIAETVLPNPVPNPLVLTATGSTPALTFDDPGTEKIYLDKVAINLTALDGSGEPIVLPPVTKDIDGNKVSDSDGDPNTFDVYCKPDANQPGGFGDFQLASFDVVMVGLPSPSPTPVGLPPITPSPTPSPTVGPTPTPTGLPPITPSPTPPPTATPTPSPTRTPIPPTPSPVGKPTPPPSPSPIPTTTPPTPFKTPTPFLPPPTPAPTGTATPLPTATPAPTPTPPLQPPLAKFSYTLQGSTALNTLTKGSMPLTGAVDTTLSVPTGDLLADLTLNDTQGRLTALGFLPVTATVGFVPSGQTSGHLEDDVLTTKSRVRIKVKSVKAFGAIPLAGGNNCQSKQLSEINLASTDSFDPTGTGGTIAGTYKISDLNGCGPLNGLISPLTAGEGNTISLRLTPKA